MLHYCDAPQICSASNNLYSSSLITQMVLLLPKVKADIFKHRLWELGQQKKSHLQRCSFHKMPSTLQGKKSLIKVQCSFLLFFLFDSASTQRSHSDVLSGFSFFSEVNFVTREQVWRLLNIRWGTIIVPPIHNIMASFRPWRGCLETALSVLWPIATCGPEHTF